MQRVIDLHKNRKVSWQSILVIPFPDFDHASGTRFACKIED